MRTTPSLPLAAVLTPNACPASQVIDYRAVDLVEHLSANYSAPDKQFDIIYDCAGFTRGLYPASPAYLKPAGIVVDICAMAMPEAAGARVRSFARVLDRTWRPSWLGGTPRRYKAAVLLGHTSVRRRFPFPFYLYPFGYLLYCTSVLYYIRKQTLQSWIP